MCVCPFIANKTYMIKHPINQAKSPSWIINQPMNHIFSQDHENPREVHISPASKSSPKGGEEIKNNIAETTNARWV